MTMLVVGENTAHIRATSLPVTEVVGVNNEQFDRELKYQISMNIVNGMLKNGTITVEDGEKWQQRLIEKYDPPISKIVSN